MPPISSVPLLERNGIAREKFLFDGDGNPRNIQLTIRFSPETQTYILELLAKFCRIRDFRDADIERAKVAGRRRRAAGANRREDKSKLDQDISACFSAYHQAVQTVLDKHGIDADAEARISTNWLVNGIVAAVLPNKAAARAFRSVCDPLVASLKPVTLYLPANVVYRLELVDTRYPVDAVIAAHRRKWLS